MEGLVQLSLNPCRGGPMALSAAPWGGLWMSTLGQTQDLDLSLSTHSLQRGSIPLSSFYSLSGFHLLKSWGAPLGPWSSLPPLAER